MSEASVGWSTPVIILACDVWLYVTLTQAIVLWKEGIAIETVSLEYPSTGKPEEHFLNQ